MKPVRYVLLNPSGNLTALVLEWGGPEDEHEIIRRLMRESEQVAFLEPPVHPDALARIRLMGGEFCGNAAMAAAGWVIRDRLENGKDFIVPLEVSGAPDPVRCRIRGTAAEFEGTVRMPQVLEIRTREVFGTLLTEVRTEGIVHLIRESGIPLKKAAAEELLQTLASELPDDAVGLLDWNPQDGFMKPLVFVRKSNTMVWETACGSGTAAIGAMEARRRGDGTVRIPVAQPGGVIRAEAKAENGTVTAVDITGTVRPGKEQILADN